MIISMIVAAAEDNAIGKGHDMLWHLPDDFKFFKRTTEGHPVIMGRKTMQSLGKPLKNRDNLVITHSDNFKVQGATIYHSLQDAIEAAKKLDDQEIFIIGGGEIYRHGLNKADRIYLTRVHGEFPGADVHFPEIRDKGWKLKEEEYHPADERHAYAFTIQVFERG